MPDTTIPGPQSHDDGLEHAHHWARDFTAQRRGPAVAHAGAVPTPSSTIHDDLHYA